MESLFSYGSNSLVVGEFYDPQNLETAHPVTLKTQDFWSSIQDFLPPPVSGNAEHTTPQELEALMRVG